MVYEWQSSSLLVVCEIVGPPILKSRTIKADLEGWERGPSATLVSATHSSSILNHHVGTGAGRCLRKHAMDVIAKGDENVCLSHLISGVDP